MRIISGSHKGRKIIAPKKLPVRPTTDRSKEALFNILQHQYDWTALAVLDLFAGTGSISYEFASRGVPDVFAVDHNRMCIDFIERTINKIGLNISVFQSEVLKYLSSSKTDFDIIFADPPYNMEHRGYLELVNSIFENNQLRADGVLIIEHSDREQLNEHPQFSDSRKYGSNIFSFFER